MKYSSKKSADNYFILYEYDYKNNLNNEDEIICYWENYEEVSKYIKYRYRDLINEYNKHKTNIINVVIENKKYKLAIFCDEKE